MDLGFAGDVVEFYHRYRHGYPAGVIDVLARLTYACGTDEDSQARYRQALAAAGFEVVNTAVDYAVDLDLEQVVGGVYSAMAADQLPAPDQRPAFAEQLGQALGGDRFREPVHVAIVAGRLT